MLNSLIINNSKYYKSYQHIANIDTKRIIIGFEPNNAKFPIIFI